ncbi:hypothetical protein J2T20_004983 [Paenibacillus wynnii]|nr:hypothetical protein [Paenibacillus wynnii]
MVVLIRTLRERIVAIIAAQSKFYLFALKYKRLSHSSKSSAFETAPFLKFIEGIHCCSSYTIESGFFALSLLKYSWISEAKNIIIAMRAVICHFPSVLLDIDINS